MFSISNNFLESSVDIKTKLESYSYIPKSKIPAMLRVLNLGILPKIDLSVLGIAIFSLSPIFKFISLANASPIIISLKSIDDIFSVINFSYK